MSEPSAQANALAERLQSREFCYMAELVASATKREEEVLEVAAKMGAVPQIAAIGVTSYAGGASGHDPVRIAAGVASLGLTPNIHITCVGQDRKGIANTMATLESLRIHNTFCISGDWPKNSPTPPVFDVDSVQLAAAVSELRRKHGTPFHISCAVSPFKYQREDCLYQYLKLEKKIAAGANMAITQVGWDAKKFIELKRYLDERGLTTPLIGNVYVLGAKAAERMGTGNPPGCWASPELVAATAREAAGADKGLAARLERAAVTVAILKGIGYAGAYIGGTHDPNYIARIIQRGEELAPRWKELLPDLQFGRGDGFYLYDPPREPKPSRTFLPMVLDAAATALPVPWVKQPRGHAGTAGAQERVRLARSPSGAEPRVRARRISVEARDLRLQELRQLRARQHGVRVPADLPEADAQRPLRRHRPRPVRGDPRAAVHLGEGDGAGRGVEPDREPQDVHPAARSSPDRHRVVAQLLSRARQPSGAPEERYRRVAGRTRRHDLESAA